MTTTKSMFVAAVALVTLAAGCASDDVGEPPATTTVLVTEPPSTEPSPPDVDTSAARSLWAAQDLTDYVLRQTYACFCPEESRGPFRVDVIGGEIVGVEHTGGLIAPPEPPVATVEELFDAIDAAVRDGVASLDVEFDPVTGVPLSVSVDVDELIFDEEYGWTTELLLDQTPTAAPPTADDPVGDDLAGDPFDGPKASAGAALIVVGVTSDDVLNVRSGPGVEADIIDTLPPTGTATATGEARLLPSSLWFEITTPGGTTGWVNRAFVAEPGLVRVVNDEVSDALDGAVATAPTLEGLAGFVAATRASDDPPSRVTIIGLSEGEVGEATVDVIGFGDDALLGERIVIFATRIGEGDGGWEAGTIEVTTLCSRGVTDDGLCL